MTVLRWDNVDSPSFTGAAASLAGAAKSFDMAGTKIAAAFKAPQEDAYRRREEARLEQATIRQQAAHDLAQQLGQYEVDTAAFDTAHQQEMFDVNKAAKGRQFRNTSAKGSAEASKEMQRRMADQITRSYTDPKSGKVDRMGALNEAARAGVGGYFMNNSIKQTYESSGNKLRDDAKKSKKYKGTTFTKAPKNLASHYLDLATTDDEAKDIWSMQYAKLRKAGANDVEARESLNQGTDYGIFETTWGNTDLIDNDIKLYDARKALYNKKT